MANPTLPAAIDFLVSGPAATLRAVTPTVVISDGLPVEASDDEVIVGVSPRDTDTEGEMPFIAFGAMLQESYDIPVAFSSWRGGSSQKTARDAVYALFNAWLTWLRANNTLGGALTFPVELRSLVYIPTTQRDPTRGEGRRATITFDVHCHSHI